MTALQPPAQKRTHEAILREIFGRGGCVDQLNSILLEKKGGGEPSLVGQHNLPPPDIDPR